VGPWKAPGAPGRFQVAVNGKTVDAEFGAKGAEWHWQSGPSVSLKAGKNTLALRDLTGFDGRCDAIILTSDADYTPPETNEILPAWRRELLGLTADPIAQGPYDLVVVGGGYAGMGAAIGAARLGCKVALIQNRHVLGGNGSSEARVWAQGRMPGGKYPLRDIIHEFMDRAKKSPGTYEEFGDAKKEAWIRSEPNVDLFLSHDALDTRTNAIKRFNGHLFVDATGHGYIGMKAGADRKMEDGGRMGMSNMWAWHSTDETSAFPKTPWALDLKEGDFPYPSRYHAQWFWESGFDKHPLNDLELIRDWNLRASYGAWNAIKNRNAYASRDPQKKGHAQAKMEWLAYVGGTRETQQLLGDVIVTQDDILSGRQYKDGCVLSTWSIDLHYPKKQYAVKYPDNPFISIAVHGRKWDHKKGYAFPYRAFYSRNIDNLFMAGRCLSVTHEALGTIRVMKTLGMVGVAVGRAAEVAQRHDCNPRTVYTDHLQELIDNLNLPGSARREKIGGAVILDPKIPVQGKGAEISNKGQDPKKLPGIIADDSAAKKTGNWGSGTGLPDFVAHYYSYSSDQNATMTFTQKLPAPGKYEVRLAYTHHENRATNTPVTVKAKDGDKTIAVNQQKPGTTNKVFHSLGTHTFGDTAVVVVSGKGTSGHICADAVQFIKAE
jgi:hypothetical protein